MSAASPGYSFKVYDPWWLINTASHGRTLLRNQISTFNRYIQNSPSAKYLSSFPPHTITMKYYFRLHIFPTNCKYLLWGPSSINITDFSVVLISFMKNQKFCRGNIRKSFVFIAFGFSQRTGFVHLKNLKFLCNIYCLEILRPSLSLVINGKIYTISGTKLTWYNKKWKVLKKF